MSDRSAQRQAASAGWIPIEPCRVVRQRRAQGQSGCGRRDHVSLVERPDRGADHQAEARQTPDVWPREARSSPGACYRLRVSSISTKSESEPLLDADPSSNGVLFPCRNTNFAAYCRKETTGTNPVTHLQVFRGGAGGPLTYPSLAKTVFRKYAI